MPGPWHVGTHPVSFALDGSFQDEWVTILDSGGNHIAYMNCEYVTRIFRESVWTSKPWGTSFRNGQEQPVFSLAANLMAAVPEMYEALENALDSLEYVERTMPGTSGYGVRQERIVAARAALAKARGEVT
jgi:hypothetical protein